MIFLQIIGASLGLIILYLIIIIFLPVLKVAKQPVENRKIDKSVPQNREDVNFSVGGLKVSAWFYKTGKDESAPCIVMSHGFGGTKDMELQKYAGKFTAQGYNVLVYDYRYFGESEGMPRQLFCAPYQIEDLRGAIKYVRSRMDVDEDKIILWGTSNGAQYGIIAASEDDGIAGVVAQCGTFDHKEDSKMYYEIVGIGHFLKLFVHAQRDKGRSRFGLSPHTFPMYGAPGTTAMLNIPGAFEGISKLAQGSEFFKNDACARLAFMPHAANPLSVADSIKCPVQILVCGEDGLVSPASHVKLAEILGDKADVKEYPIGHFDIYFGEHFERATDDVLEFLDKALN